MSHAMLLRLFLAPSFFSVHVALKYMMEYSDHIGITYYLTRRLREIDIGELREVWGFICHLLVTRPSKSRALECFVVDTAQRSTHIAMITLWFMQAYLKDFPHNTQSFVICQRILHSCHEIIFGDVPAPSSGPYLSLSLPLTSRLGRKKVKPHLEPALVGIASVLAGVPGMPDITRIVGNVAVEQGRVVDEGDDHDFKSIEPPVVHSVTPSMSPEMTKAELEDSEEDEANVDVEDVDQGTVTKGRRRAVTAAQTVPALPLHLKAKRRPRLSHDPFGQLDPEVVPSAYQSAPSISRLLQRPNPANAADELLQNYDYTSQIHLLRSHYCRSEIQFILTLENISNRLLVVPRPARVSALRAELTALNHQLPAEVCMPMWCTTSDQPHPDTGIPHPHHRIVRIPPGESVVLNSAERAPYLLLIEVLNDDLDFDPAKRANREILKKMVAKTEQDKSGTVDAVPFAMTRTRSSRASPPPTAGILRPTSPTAVPSEADDDEMDLVEQVYGPDSSLRSADLADSIVLPLPPKNRELELAAWSRPTAPNTPAIEEMPNSAHLRNNSGETAISLDEYSERMRTAAIMLAQLNETLVRDPHANDAQGNGTADASAANHPAGRAHEGGSRMRLSYADATAIRERIMKEMLALEEERMERMRESQSSGFLGRSAGGREGAMDENIIRRELNKADPSAVVVSESWAAKKSRIRQASPYGHLASWDCISVIIKTGGDLRQEQLATQLISQFQQIWKEEGCACWVRPFTILITGGTSGLVETITDAMSIHSIKKAEYARRLTTGRLGHVTLFDHFRVMYGDPSSAKFARAQKNFAKSLAGYSLVTYFLQIKDRHNGNILIDREGHVVHIDFGFMLSNTPGNLGFEAAPFKLPVEYVDVLGGIEGAPFLEFRKLFREGFEAARKHCDRIITLVELMQKDSALPCFALFGGQTATQLRERFQPALTHALVGDHVNRLIDTSLGSHWTRLYDSYQYYSQSIL
ncbi:kinase-like domain-containing protein [Schizophyllum commune]